MRVTHCTLWITPDHRDCAHVVSVADPGDDAYSAARLRSEMQHRHEGLQVFQDLRVPDGLDQRAVVERVMESWRRGLQREADMALTYHYYAHLLPSCTDGGVMAMTLPAPLGAPDLREVLRQLVLHPRYRRQTVRLISQDGEAVVAENGVVAEPN